MAYCKTDDNVKLCYEVSGKGDTTLLLIHGWSVSSKYFKKQIPELSKDYTVVSFDLRGHGESEVPENGYTVARYAQDVKNLINHLNLGKVVMIGWSLGVLIIFDYIRQFGCEEILKIVSIDMTAKMVTDDTFKYGVYGNFSHKDNIDVLRNMNDNWLGFVSVFAPCFYAKSGCKVEGLVDWTLEQEAKNSPNVVIRVWVDISGLDYREVLPKITVPALITYGGESVFYSPDVAEYLHSQIKDSRVVGFEKSGHALMLEEPDKFNQEVRAFIG